MTRIRIARAACLWLLILLPLSSRLLAGAQIGPEASPQLVVSEINFHSDTLLNSDDWFELWNAGTSSLDLAGWTIDDGDPLKKWTFPAGTTLAAGARLVLFENATRFNSIHPGVSNKLGPLPFALSNNGDSLTIKNAQQSIQLIIKYKDGPKWPCTTDGFGRTLELTDPAADPNEPESWFAGCIGGSPGKVYSACPDFPTISEINYNSASNADAGDWFEILNTGTSVLNLVNWIVRDDDDQHAYKIPANTTVPAGGRLVIFADQAKFVQQHPAVTNRVGPLGFGLGNSGDVLRLYDATGLLRNSVCYLDTLPWPIEADGDGKTLEFKTGDSPNTPGSWFAGCDGGSPGTAYDPSCGTIGTDEAAASGLHLAIFPNPADEVVFVKIAAADFSERMSVRMYDALGRQVFAAENVENGGSFAVQHLPSGLYQVLCQTVSGLAVGQFLRQ